MREFVRHPSNIPIELEESDKISCQQTKLNNLSYGGISCVVDHSIPSGTNIKIRIPILKSIYESIGIVVWCKKNSAHYDVGIQFVDQEEAFKSKMVEQVCQIESYRQAQIKQGRSLSSEVAAVEWIEQNAASFDEQYVRKH